MRFNTEASATNAVGPTGEEHTTVEKISQSYTVKEGDAIVGATTIYIFRNGGITQYFDNLTITRGGTAAVNTVNANVNAATQKVVKTANYIMKDGKKYNYAGQLMK